MTDYKLFDITDVKNWLTSEGNVELPTIQRGFVWKASQIESLWDSVFRGYPIGSMMLTQQDEDKKYLLDGQQRATAIALGFFNPWDNKNTRQIGNATNLPVIWMDINPRELTISQKYVFRVVTRSHPWGYQLRNNTERLTVSQITDAWESLHTMTGENLYTSLQPHQRIPYDATLPVPLAFLLEACITDNPIENLIELCKKHSIRPLTGYEGDETPENIYLKNLRDFLATPKGKTLMETIRDCVLKTKIPAIIVPHSMLKETDEDDEHENESTLFIRLNRAGTRIDGEELIYSIYKSVFPHNKELVEKTGVNFIAPSRIISLVGRLAFSDWQNGLYCVKLSLKKFRDWIANDAYKRELEGYMHGEDGHKNLKRAIENAIEVLQCAVPGDSHNRVPDVVVKKFIRQASDGFLLLLYWLLKNNITETPAYEQKRLICARLYSLWWFGNISSFARQNWANISDKDFWSRPVDNTKEFLLYPLPQSNVLQEHFIARTEGNLSIYSSIEPGNRIWEIWKESISCTNEAQEKENEIPNRITNGWNDFLNRLLWNRQLVLLAQRYYINSSFGDYNQLEDLEDSNVPWDWDHIYPGSWVYYKKDIDWRMREWEWRIGNLRAMSLSDNRSENNHLSPNERLQSAEDREKYFIKDNDWQYWQYIDKYGDKKDLISYHTKAIITRTLNIYRNFLEMFGITGKE